VYRLCVLKFTHAFVPIATRPPRVLSVDIDFRRLHLRRASIFVLIWIFLLDTLVPKRTYLQVRVRTQTNSTKMHTARISVTSNKQVKDREVAITPVLHACSHFVVVLGSRQLTRAVDPPTFLQDASRISRLLVCWLTIHRNRVRGFLRHFWDLAMGGAHSSFQRHGCDSHDWPRRGLLPRVYNRSGVSIVRCGWFVRS